jgi:hypothetical protein
MPVSEILGEFFTASFRNRIELRLAVVARDSDSGRDGFGGGGPTGEQFGLTRPSVGGKGLCLPAIARPQMVSGKETYQAINRLIV